MNEDVNVNEEDKTSRVRPDTGNEDGTVGDQHARGIDNNKGVGNEAEEEH